YKKLKKIVKSLEETIDWIENYIEEQTGLELGKRLSDSDLSSCDFQLRAGSADL
ncbi:41450_t:CDS:1, partial [Gigaspora margarita]